MTERIYLQIDLTELNELTSRLDRSMDRMVQLDLFGKRIRADTFKLDARTKSIITRLPLLREANILWREIQALSSAVAGAEGAAGLVATGASTLLLMVVLMSLMKRIERIQKQMIRDMQGFEDEIRRGLELTHTEFMEMERDVIGYATQWEQLTARLKDATSKEALDAIADYVIGRIGAFEARGAAAGYGDMPPEPEWVTDLKKWWDNLPKDRDYIYDANIEVPPGE